ncbi:MAG: hypothetical protein CM1200mP2_56550 [Planctomycetaceae bacterium]|nr:MAG: hypothetical protein CM1200mP2_56550 [Planctomycetaceae bacterium]
MGHKTVEACLGKGDQHVTRIALLLALWTVAAAAEPPAQSTDADSRPAAEQVLEKVGGLEIPDVSQLVRVDRKKRPSRAEMKNSAFILKTRPHPVAGDRYVVLTDHREASFLSSLQRLAKARDGIILKVDDLATLGQDPKKLVSIRQKLRDARVRFLAVAPRKESFRENMVLGLWELTSTLDADPQVDVLPGILLASTARHLSGLVDRSLRHKPLPVSQLKPLAISQVPRAEELRPPAEGGSAEEVVREDGCHNPDRGCVQPSGREGGSAHRKEYLEPAGDRPAAVPEVISPGGRRGFSGRRRWW